MKKQPRTFRMRWFRGAALTFSSAVYNRLSDYLINCEGMLVMKKGSADKVRDIIDDAARAMPEQFTKDSRAILGIVGAE